MTLTTGCCCRGFCSRPLPPKRPAPAAAECLLPQNTAPGLYHPSSSPASAQGCTLPLLCRFEGKQPQSLTGIFVFLPGPQRRHRMLERQRLGQSCRYGLKGSFLPGLRMQHPSLESHVELYPSFQSMPASPYRVTSLLFDASKHQPMLHMFRFAPSTSNGYLNKGHPTSSRPVRHHGDEHPRTRSLMIGDAAACLLALCMHCAWSDVNVNCSVDHIMAHLPLHHGWAFPHPRGRRAL